jgi:hypothetical protein
LLRRLEIQMDAWLQDDVIDIDTQRSGGVLELSFPGRQQDRRQQAAPAAGNLAGRPRGRISFQVGRCSLA